MTMNEDQEWKPQAEGLQQIIQLLKESQSIDNTIQKNVQKVICVIVVAPFTFLLN
jgi:hypothetical protein